MLNQYYDFTPEVLRDDPVCEQCGNLSQHIVSVDNVNGELFVSWDDWVSCTALTTFYGTAEEFLEWADKFQPDVDSDFTEDYQNLVDEIQGWVNSH